MPEVAGMRLGQRLHALATEHNHLVIRVGMGLLPLKAGIERFEVIGELPRRFHQRTPGPPGQRYNRSGDLRKTEHPAHRNEVATDRVVIVERAGRTLRCLELGDGPGQLQHFLQEFLSGHVASLPNRRVGIGGGLSVADPAPERISQ